MRYKRSYSHASKLAALAFALVLLTPDDVGAARGGEHSLKPRARQNVILELGYFMGRLGRTHVAALLKGNIEKPSDYDGVVYTQWTMPGVEVAVSEGAQERRARR